MTQRIKNNQKFLLKLLNLHIGGYYPLRKWLGIDYKGKIDEVSHLSIAYNHYKGGKKLTTRIYQHPDLGYKLNLVLDKIPQLALLPALLQPAYGLGALAFFFLTQTTYQPSGADTYLNKAKTTNNYGSSEDIWIYRQTNNYYRTLLYFDVSDIPNGVTFSQGDLLLYAHNIVTGADGILNRLTQTAWVEGEATWNSYSSGNSWTTAGGDFTSTNAVTLSNITTTGWKTWEAASLIQDCYDNQSKKVHLLLKSQEDNQNCAVAFYSKEYATDTSLRPKLTVTYTTATTPTDNATFFGCNF